MIRTLIPTMVLALFVTALIATGCGGDDGGEGSGDSGPVPGADTAALDSQSIYDDCVESAQYATEEQAKEACVAVQDEFDDCVSSGETNLGTPATPEDCVPDLLRQ